MILLLAILNGMKEIYFNKTVAADSRSLVGVGVMKYMLLI